MVIRTPPTSLRLAPPPASPDPSEDLLPQGNVSLKVVQVRQSNVNRFKCNSIRSNLFDRLTRVVRSYANAVLSSFEDPEKILEQAVLEINNDLTKMRQALHRSWHLKSSLRINTKLQKKLLLIGMVGLNFLFKRVTRILLAKPLSGVNHTLTMRAP